MKRVVVSLLALSAVAVASDRAFAEGALSYPMAAHVVAKYGVQHPGLPVHVQRHQARQYHYGSRTRHHGRPVYRPHHGRPAVIVHPPVHRYPVVVHPPVYSSYPYYHAPYPYYHAPRGGFTYHGRGFSIGVGF